MKNRADKLHKQKLTTCRKKIKTSNTSKTSEKHNKTSETSMSTDIINIVNNNTVFQFNAVTSISNT